MNLAAAVKKHTKTRPPRLLDRIYAQLDPEDREVLVSLMRDETVSGYAIAGALRDLGHQIVHSTINLERRNGWEPM